jgi:hypothetical protein
VTFPVNKLALKDAEELIRNVLKYQGAFQGTICSLPQSRQIMVTDTVGRLRTVKQQLDRAEGGGAETDMSETPTIEVYPVQVFDPASGRARRSINGRHEIGRHRRSGASFAAQDDPRFGEQTRRPRRHVRR